MAPTMGIDPVGAVLGLLGLLATVIMLVMKIHKTRGPRTRRNRRHHHRRRTGDVLPMSIQYCNQHGQHGQYNQPGCLGHGVTHSHNAASPQAHPRISATPQPRASMIIANSNTTATPHP